MKQYLLVVIVCLLPLGVLTGCAPGLGTDLEVTYLPPVVIEQAEKGRLQKLEGLPFRVGIFSDDRAVQNSIEIDGRPVAVKGTLALLAQDAFKEVLKVSKADNCATNCIVISGRIKEWKMKVTPDFPTSTAKANVELEVEFSTSEGYSIAGLPTTLTGRASGSSQRTHPLLNEQQMTEVFGEALNEAAVGAMLQMAKSL